MNEQSWKRKEYESWDEAFRGLLPQIRQQSVRVATYTQVLFVQACASSYGKNIAEWAERMKDEYADLAYKCGLYHQLGKALLTPEHQLWRKVASSEEKAIYQTYPSEGRLLVAKLQDKKMQGEQERPTQNIPWLMIREACEQHMERWNGTGYPKGLVGDEISPIAQIVGLAKELDQLVSETKSENPFDEAYVILLQKAGKEFSEELMEVLKASRGKCRGVYKQYIQYTKTLPKTIPLVDKRPERTMGLQYRPIGDALYEAVPWFAGVLNEPEARESMEVLEPMMIRTKMLHDIMFYFLYEAADAVLRMQNCQLQNNGILVPMAAGFYQGDSQRGRFEQLLREQPIDSSKLMLTVPMQAVFTANKQEKQNLIEYIESGIQLVLDSYHPDELSMEQIQEIGFAKVRIAPDLAQELREETQNMLQSHGITCINYGVAGTEVEEETLIQELLLGER